MDKELQFQCLKIPIKVLRKELPNFKSNKRQDFLDELENKNPEKLKRLAMYYSMNKTSSIYLYDLKKELNKLKFTKQNIQALLNKKIQSDGGPIFVINQINLDDKRKEAYIRIQGYSNIKTLKAARPQTLESFKEDYRSKFLMYLSIHFDTNHLECRSGFLGRAKLSSNILSQALFDKEDEFKLIILTKEQQNRIYKSAKAKKVYIEKLNWSGCEYIYLKGEDVERTINEFKRKKLDFEAMGATIKFDDRKASDGFTFFSDGKISFKKIDHPYDKIKGILTEKKNEQLSNKSN